MPDYFDLSNPSPLYYNFNVTSDYFTLSNSNQLYCLMPPHVLFCLNPDYFTCMKQWATQSSSDKVSLWCETNICGIKAKKSVVLIKYRHSTDVSDSYLVTMTSSELNYFIRSLYSPSFHDSEYTKDHRLAWWENLFEKTIETSLIHLLQSIVTMNFLQSNCTVTASLISIQWK